LKKFVVTSVIVIVALSAWLVNARLERAKHESETAQARREAAHRAALAPYQHNLPIGTPRADVDKYLASIRAIPATAPGELPTSGRSYQVLIGEEPGDSFACDRWNVYVVMEFKSASDSRDIPLPADTLQRIHIEQAGHCL
jgi:hypothetical protein